MKTLVFSDTHLTNYFEPRKFEYLASIIDDADKVVINGDFWDSYFITFDQFVDSEWKRLFPLLKAKKAVYLYGNHDSPIWAKIDERVGLFSSKAKDSFKLKSKGLKFHIEHGHMLYPELGPKFIWLKETKLYKVYFTKVWDALDGASYKIFHNTPMGKTINTSVKRIMKNIKKDDEIFVMGHSHYYEVDNENKYINTGANRYGFGNYLLIDDGNYKLVNRLY